MSSSSPRPAPPAIADDWALFLDVDGTLLEFADTPDGVQVPSGLPPALARLRTRLGGALALVSGRSLQALDTFFPSLQLPAAGLHGLERRLDRSRVAAPEPPAALDTLRRRAEAVPLEFPGAVVEDKGAALALHWRGNPHAQAPFRHLADAALPDLPGYRLQPGDRVLELRPGGADKGSAIDAMMDEPPFAGRTPVFVGDDLTDEHGFEVVLARGGIAVLVGNREPSVARHRLANPAAVLDWLEAGARAEAGVPA